MDLWRNLNDQDTMTNEWPSPRLQLSSNVKIQISNQIQMSNDQSPMTNQTLMTNDQGEKIRK